MASNIKLKRSAVSGKQPHVDDLELGELALNTFDGKLFAEVNTGIATVVEIGSNLTNQNVSGVSTVGILTVTNDANVDGTLHVGGVQVSGGGAVIGADITTRNLTATGVSTFVGNSAFNANVGINTTTYPDEALRVVGDIRVTGVATIGPLTFPSADGDANQVLRTNGSGRLEFAPGGSTTITHVLPVGTRTILANNVIQVVHVPITSGINTVDGRSGEITVDENASVDVRTSTDPNGKTLTETFFNTFA